MISEEFPLKPMILKIDNTNFFRPDRARVLEVQVWGRAPSPVQAERSSAAAQPQQLLDSRLSPRCRLHKNGRPVRQNFRDALHHFGSVVAGADHGIAANLRRVLQHQVERFGARLLA